MEIKFEQCGQIGTSCYVKRNNEDNPNEVTMKPCCDYLICAGIGPDEVKNIFENAIRVDPLSSSGICTLTLDHNLGPKEQDKYLAYVEQL